MDILDYIPIGSEHAVRRAYLSLITRTSDRDMRKMIHEARHRIPIINMSNGNGYYIPDMNNNVDAAALVNWVRQEERRARSINLALEAAKKTLQNCGIKWRTYEQQEQREEG